jgi:hypothetical protein
MGPRRRRHWAPSRVGNVDGEVRSTPLVDQSASSVFSGECCAQPVVRFGGTYRQRVEGVDCDAPVRLVCLACGAAVVVRCGSSQVGRCAPCARRYRNRVRRLIQDGIECVPMGTAVLLTVTAPSEKGVHCLRHRKCGGGGWDCVPCLCSPVGGVDLAEWNPGLTKRMNRVLEAMRRGEASPLVGGRRCPVAFEYLQGRELQERGALHVHAVLLPRGRAPLQFDRKALRELVMRHGFGHELDLERIGTSRHGGSKAKSPGRVAAYVSKYVSKAADARGRAPWASLPRRRQAPYRTWTCSRAWPRSMKEVRSEQQRWARAAAGGRRS